MRAAVEQLGQREVVPGVRSRSGAHRHAEAGAARIGAGHRDDEGPGAACGVADVDVVPAEQDDVVDGQGVQVARPHPEQRVRPGAVGRLGPCSLTVNSSPVRRPRQISSEAGKNTGLGDCAPAANPKSASSSRRRSR